MSSFVEFTPGTRGVIGIGRLSGDANRAGGSLDKSGGNDWGVNDSLNDEEEEEAEDVGIGLSRWDCLCCTLGDRTSVDMLPKMGSYSKSAVYAYMVIVRLHVIGIAFEANFEETVKERSLRLSYCLARVWYV